MNCPIQLDSVSVRYGSMEVLHSITFTFDRAEFLAIAGPNGAGKSTLLSVIAGLTPTSAGDCRLGGREISNWNRREFARRVAVVQQTAPSEFPFTVEEVVYMGRMPHRSGLGETSVDHQAVASALEVTETSAFRRRLFRTLSGGERQRVLLASALAQYPEVLLLDEPSTHLDLHHQVALHRLLRDLGRRGLLVVSVTHDLNLAAAYVDRLLLLQRGRLRASGPVKEVFRSDLIEEVFEIPVELHRRSSGQPWIVYGS